MRDKKKIYAEALIRGRSFTLVGKILERDIFHDGTKWGQTLEQDIGNEKGLLKLQNVNIYDQFSTMFIGKGESSFLVLFFNLKKSILRCLSEPYFTASPFSNEAGMLSTNKAWMKVFFWKSRLCICVLFIIIFFTLSKLTCFDGGFVLVKCWRNKYNSWDEFSGLVCINEK